MQHVRKTSKEQFGIKRGVLGEIFTIERIMLKAKEIAESGGSTGRRSRTKFLTTRVRNANSTPYR